MGGAHRDCVFHNLCFYMVAFTPINPQLGRPLSFLGARWGRGSVCWCLNRPEHRGSACWPVQVSVSTSVSLGLATFPQPPGFHNLHSQVPPGPQLTRRVVSIGSQSLCPPTPSNVSLSRGLCAGPGEGWGVDSQHSWALRFPRRPLSRLPPSHTLFLSGCFFLSRTLQGQTKADWQCLPPYPLHLGKLSRGEGFREFFVGVAACFLPQPGLELRGFPP